MASTNSKNLKITAFNGGLIGIGGKVAGKGTANNPHSPDGELTAVPSTSGTSAAAAVHISLIRSKDSAKCLPAYSATLQRGADDTVAAEELDTIQLELETLLSSVSLRGRILKMEYENLDKDERRIDRRNKEKQPNSPAAGTTAGNNGGSVGSNGKRKREELGAVRKKHSTMTILKQQVKQAKNSPLATHTDDSMDYNMTPTCSNAANGVVGNAAAASVGPSAGVPTTSSYHANAHMQRNDHHLQKMLLPKNDMPNKFWLSVEPYCMPLTHEDMRLIDDLLEQYKGPLVPPIPELGPHYSTVWAAEDLKEMQQASNPTTNGNRLKPQNNASASTSGVSMLKKAESKMSECVTGPLTQRLVSALMEEQMIQNPSEQAAVGEHSNSSSSENVHSNMPYSNYRSLNMMKNCVGIEKRVKKELIEQGILDVNDYQMQDNDEILAEIKRVTAEINSVALHNSSELKRLHAIAAEEIKRLEVKRKLDAVDQEILEVYKRYMQYKSKRKSFSIEEQQEVYRLTAEQRMLSDQLERIQGLIYK